jgi:hypothetical protein
LRHPVADLDVRRQRPQVVLAHDAADGQHQVPGQPVERLDALPEERHLVLVGPATHGHQGDGPPVGRAVPVTVGHPAADARPHELEAVVERVRPRLEVLGDEDEIEILGRGGEVLHGQVREAV